MVVIDDVITILQRIEYNSEAHYVNSLTADIIGLSFGVMFH